MPSDLPWAYVYFGAETSIWLDQLAQVYADGVKLSLPGSIDIQRSRRFNFTFSQGLLYMQPYAPLDWDIYSYQIENKTFTKLLTANGPADMVASDLGLYYTSSKNNMFNIYQLAL